MNENNLDQLITDSLHKNTEDTSSLKEQTFKNIMEQIKEIERGGIIMKRKSKMPKIASMILVAIIAVMALMATTDTGQAAIGKIKEFFAPEKKIEQELEGNKEDVNLELEEKMDYIIYVDKNVYKMESENGIDRIVPKETFVEDLPEISMTIEQRENEKPETIATELMENLKSKFVTLEKLDIDEPVTSILVFGHGGSNWDSVIQRYYLVDNTKEGTFIITQTYFLEASEGHGVRFDNMVKEFKIVPRD